MMHVRQSLVRLRSEVPDVFAMSLEDLLLTSSDIEGRFRNCILVVRETKYIYSGVRAIVRALSNPL